MLRRINLVPKIPAALKLRRLSPLLLAATFLLTVAVLYGGNLRLHGQTTALAAEIEQLEAAARRSEVLQAAVRQLNDQVETRRRQVAAVADQARRLSGEIAGKAEFSALLAEISRAIPPSIRCDEIVMHAGGGTIRGLAVQYQELPLMVNELRRSSRFSSAIIQEIDRGEERSDGPFLFTIVFQLAPRG